MKIGLFGGLIIALSAIIVTILPLDPRLSLQIVLAQSASTNELLSLTNAARQKAGLNPLRLSLELSQAAQRQAEDMVKNKFIGHQGTDGSQPGERAQKAGYSSDYVGENIAAGRLTPSKTIEGWLNNPQYRTNLLNPKYTDVGFGYVNDPQSQYQNYWVQVFGKSSSKSWQTSLNSSDCQGQEILRGNTCNGDNFSPEEAKLARLIDQYRANNQLSPIPISSSLNRVANRHSRDLQENLSLYRRNGKDWRFGWSNCVYDGQQPSTFSCMWAAPQRLQNTDIGRGYELICGGVGTITAEDALRCWQNSRLNDDLLLNQGLWRNIQWQGIGISIDRGYAVLWLQEGADGWNLPQSPYPLPTNAPQPQSQPGRVW